MKKILITGATGFIGGFLVDEARKRGYEVFAAVRRTSNIRHLENKDIRIIEFDFTDGDRLNALIRDLPRFDCVIHNAGVTKSLRRDDYFEVNERNTARFIAALDKPGRTPDKFLFVSSLAAYGPGDPESGRPVLLTSKPCPVTAYGESKLAAEKFLTGRAGLPYIIIRPTAVYGPGEKDIFGIIKLMCRGVDFRIGSGHQHLTFIYVKDLARLVLDTLESPRCNRAYFATDGNLYGSRDLGDVVSRLLDRKMAHIVLPVWLAKVLAALTEFACRISGQPPGLNRDKLNELGARNWNCEVEPLRTELNFKAEYNLETGIKETIDWYKKEKWIQ